MILIFYNPYCRADFCARDRTACWSSSARLNIFEKRRATSESPVAVQTFTKTKLSAPTGAQKKYLYEKTETLKYAYEFNFLQSELPCRFLRQGSNGLLELLRSP